ncbi:putative Plastid division1 [Hibiscus syriacus]|uniref:RING-type E3 ubiquitin transferase n=1 Tax=Hibiscus syriacus TaxID=106335 RepID=A0A6A2YIT7_HIBSY|nr:RING-H2 finger protein ATL5-like [Hibiscus syriacus]KAE8676697.1 putative Plastid division1 [Hibiscus syriacus]
MDLEGNHIDYALNGKAILCVGVVLFVAVIIVLCFHNYVRVLFRDGRRRYMRRRALRLLSISTAGTTSITVGSKGLDSSIIETIPIIVYATGSSYFPPLECAVCLSEFENDDRTRVLPKCKHTFHVDCIDMWFYSHSNCPLCRAQVQAVISVNPKQTADVVFETAGSEPVRDVRETKICSPSSSSSSLEMGESCPMKKLELVGIVVELPPIEVSVHSNRIEFYSPLSIGGRLTSSLGN